MTVSPAGLFVKKLRIDKEKKKDGTVLNVNEEGPYKLLQWMRGVRILSLLSLFQTAGSVRARTSVARVTSAIFKYLSPFGPGLFFCSGDIA